SLLASFDARKSSQTASDGWENEEHDDESGECKGVRPEMTVGGLGTVIECGTGAEYPECADYQPDQPDKR
ncbi:hypothetical protein PENTCL1PPCAC_15642, partial [Pristionchus entomophagus]